MLDDFKKLAQNILDQYYQVLAADIKKNGFCTEFLGESKKFESTRLLCQTRCMYFLLEYALLKPSSNAFEHALTLYKLIKDKYQSSEGIWLQYPGKENLENLYEYAFLIFSISKLYQQDPQPEYQEDLVALHSVIQIKYFFPETNFSNLKDNDGLVSQNALMHVYEAYLELCIALPETAYQETLKALLKATENMFFDKSKKLISEYSPYHTNPTYEPGHSFEWCCLMVETNRAKVLEGTPLLPAKEIAITAEQNGVTKDNVVLQSISNLQDKERFRIWPMFERLRFYGLTNNLEKIEHVFPTFNQYFIDKNQLPIEWIDSQLKPDFKGVKTTTSYHIINCLKNLV